MPLYEYRCDACGAQFERIRKFSDPPLEVCPECGKGPVEKLISSPAFQFKGSGWYITDYARKSESSGAGESGSGGKGEASEKSDKSEKTDKKESTSTEATKESKPAAADQTTKSDKAAPATAAKDK
jgi:putative FmdB family regulatory protein